MKEEAFPVAFNKGSPETFRKWLESYNIQKKFKTLKFFQNSKIKILINFPSEWEFQKTKLTERIYLELKIGSEA